MKILGLKIILPVFNELLVKICIKSIKIRPFYATNTVRTIKIKITCRNKLKIKKITYSQK